MNRSTPMASTPRLSLTTTLCLVALAAPGCSSSDAATNDRGGRVAVTISGEDLAVDGIPFPLAGEVALADGWALTFSHVLVTVGRVRLSEDPDRAPTDQSQMGAEVVRAEGPFAVDLHRAGDVPGAGGEGTAIALTTLSGDLASDRRYALSYDTLPASAEATRVNFADDAEASALYERMIAAGYTVAYAGTATFRGTNCVSSAQSYDFAALPTTVEFELGFATPVSALNCQNQENQGDPFAGEEYQRGVALRGNTTALAQLTIHVDHPFYSDVEHEPALYFDQFAARAPSGAALTMDALVGLDPTAFVDGAGAPLPWRSCDGSALPAGAQRGFGVGSVPVNPSADPAAALRDYRDYVQYVQSSQTHLNGGEGLCFIQRNYPSPP